MKYSSYMSFIWKNPVAQFLYRKTEKPILSIMGWCGKHVGVTVLILLVIGMGLRIGYRGMVDRLERDEITHIAMVKTFIAAHGDVEPELQKTLIHVGYILHQLNLDVEMGLRCFNLICSCGWLFVMYLLGKTFFNSSKTGLICLALAVFNPYTIRISGQIMREPLYLLILSSCLLCASKVILCHKTILYSILLGVLPVLGILSRYEGIELFMIMPLTVIICGLSIPRANRKRLYLHLAGNFIIYIITLVLSFSVFFMMFPSYEASIETKILWNYRNIFDK